jgi:integrase
MKYKRIPQGEHSQLIIEEGEEGSKYKYKEIRQIESDIIDFVIFLKERHYTLSSQKTYLNALIHFFSINDITLNRKKISKFMPNDDLVSETLDDVNEGGAGGDDNDKPYTREQIAKLLDFADIRTKVMILLMSSAGLRLGALELLKIRDLTPVDTHKIYQIRAYANSPSSKHYTFCTPECRKAIDNYIDYRKQCGENITARSPLLLQIK